MQAATPEVVDSTLTLDRGGQPRTIAVGSAAWFEWLRTARAFVFREDGASFSARKQRQGDHWYWYAYTRRDGRLRCVYLGKPADISAQRLQEVMGRLHPLPDVPVPSIVAARFGRRSAVVRRTTRYLLAAGQYLDAAREASLDGEALQAMLDHLTKTTEETLARGDLHQATMLDLVLTWALSLEGQRNAQAEALSIARRLLQEAQQHDTRLARGSMTPGGELH